MEFVALCTSYGRYQTCSCFKSCALSGLMMTLQKWVALIGVSAIPLTFSPLTAVMAPHGLAILCVPTTSVTSLEKTSNSYQTLR